MQNPYGHSCKERVEVPLIAGVPQWPTRVEDCPACAYERGDGDGFGRGIAQVVKATGISRAAIEAGVVLLMRDVCAAVLQAHTYSRGLDTLDAKIREQEEYLVSIMGMLALRDTGSRRGGCCEDAARWERDQQRQGRIRQATIAEVEHDQNLRR